MKRTLLAQLLGWSLGALVLVWLGFVVVGFQTGFHESQELTDGHLASVATLLLSETHNEFAESRDIAAVSAAHGESSMRAHDYQQSLSVAVWDAQGRLLSRTGDAPLPPFDSPEGFATLTIGEPATAWRTFARWRESDHSRRVMVLLSVDERDDLAWDIALQVAEPGLWMLPVVALVLGLAIRRGLRPLHDLSKDVNALDVRRPDPLAPVDRPAEFDAVVEAIDTLVARYHAALGHERQLANELAHELRTPLAALTLHAGTLRGNPAEEERRAAIEQVEKASLRAGQLLTQLLALARASRTELAEAAVPLDMAALAREVVAEYAQIAVDSGHDLGLSAPSRWDALGHPVLLEMALRNLIDNALAHTPRGTRIEVLLDDARGWLQVSDDGAGARAVFDATLDAPGFGRWPAPRRSAGRGSGDADATNGSRALGLGLGLGHRVVEKVAAIHGGSFGPATPPEGFSTSYRMELPALRKAVPP